jgi:uncharacterized iron-regulated protein
MLGPTQGSLPRRTFVLGTAALLASGCRRGRTSTPEPTGPTHAIYDARGAPSSLATFAASCADADVIAFGELHGHAIGSALQLELLHALFAQPRPVALAMEFFEADTQPDIDAYLAGEIDEATFRAKTKRDEAYATSHRPLVELCRERGARVVAANAPRSLVTAYRKSSLDYAAYLATLTAEERGLLPATSVPPDDEHRRRFMKVMGPERGPPFFKSMALWNDAMAESVARARAERPELRVLLIVGTFHVAARLGTITQIAARSPDATIRVLTMRNGGTAWRASDADEGDLVVCVA